MVHDGHVRLAHWEEKGAGGGLDERYAWRHLDLGVGYPRLTSYRRDE